MEVTFAALADAANISREGKLNITGIFSNVSASAFPARHHGSVLVILTEWTPAEFEDHHLEVRFVDAEGNRVMQLDMDFEVNPPNRDRVAKKSIFVALSETPLPEEGEYSFDLFFDGRYRYSVPLIATFLPGTTSAT